MLGKPLEEVLSLDIPGPEGVWLSELDSCSLIQFFFWLAINLGQSVLLKTTARNVNKLRIVIRDLLYSHKLNILRESLGLSWTCGLTSRG